MVLRTDGERYFRTIGKYRLPGDFESEGEAVEATIEGIPTWEEIGFLTAALQDAFEAIVKGNKE